jgi:ABC-type sugar transport system ATPase subunit
MIRVEALRVRAGEFALGDIGFEIPTGAYALLTGRTGSGKTTLLEAVCGLREVEAGRIVLMGRDVTRLPPAARGIGFVPQDGVPFRTLSVYENLAFAPRVHGWTAVDIDRRVNELAELLGIGALLDRRPRGLSGGEIQRVALGRALAARPPVLCLDEPLSALDSDTRADMLELLRSVREKSGVTTLHITHDVAETLPLADRVLALEGGRVVERPMQP